MIKTLYCCVWLLAFLHLATPFEPANLESLLVDSKHQQTIAFKYLHEGEQQQIQEEILDVLGLDHRPKPRKHVLSESAPQYLLDLYTSFQKSGDSMWTESTPHFRFNQEYESNHTVFDLAQADIIMSFLNQIKAQRHNKHLRHNRDRRFWFNITDVPTEAEVFDVELRLYREASKSHLNSGHQLELTLYQLSYGLNRDEVIMNFVNRIQIDGHVNGWITFNVTQPFDNWLRYPTQNLGLYLQIRTKGIDKDLSPRKVGIVNSRGEKKYQPFMTAYIQSKPQSPEMMHSNRPVGRGKRATTKKRSEKDVSFSDPDKYNPYLQDSESRTCQKRTLYVSFKNLNWQDWIIAPEGYSAFFCEGECLFPMSNRDNATSHAILQYLVHVSNPENVPKPCCAPKELSPIMVLYFDDNSNVVLKKYKNMVVNSCGCH